MSVQNKTTTRDCKPDGYGPGTDGPVWNEQAVRWEFPLNALGRATAERFMAKYHQKPENSIANFKAGKRLDGIVQESGASLLAAARQLLGTDELRSIACRAVVRSSAHYDPIGNGCSEDGFTYLVYGIYMSVRRAVDLALRAKDKSRECQPPDYGPDETDSMDCNEGHDADPADEAELREWRVVLDDLSRGLTEREKKAILAHYRLGMNCTEVGRMLKVSRERGRQLVAEGVRKMKEAARRRGLTRNTPGEGPNLPPIRSVRCIPRNRSAAIR